MAGVGGATPTEEGGGECKLTWQRMLLFCVFLCLWL